MPGGDRTGPMGLGPFVGRGLGYCADYPLAGNANQYSQRGRRFGLGSGRASGWYSGFYRTNAPGPRMDKQTEIGVLKVQAQELERVLNQINARLTELADEKQP
jgi:hypothetical protein